MKQSSYFKILKKLYILQLKYNKTNLYKDKLIIMIREIKNS